MKKLSILFLVVISQSLSAQSNFDYPKPWKSDSVDIYFGTKVADPYRWLEDINSPKTLDWVARENAITDQYESGKRSLKSGIIEKLNQYGWSASKRFMKHGNYYFHYSIYDDKKPPVLFSQKSFDGIATVIVDPEDFKEKKTDVISIKDFEVSHDSRYLAFSLSESGADWCTLRVIEMEGKRLQSDIIKNVKFPDISWKGYGFFYKNYDAVNGSDKITARMTNPKLYYHKLGENPTNDRLIFEPPSKVGDEWLGFSVTSDEKFLIVYTYLKKSDTTLQKAVLYASLDSFPGIHLRPLLTFPRSAKYDFTIIDNVGSSFLVKTDLNALTGRILLYTPTQELSEYREIVPQFKNVLKQVSYSDGKIICLYYLNGQYMTCVYNLEGKMIKQIRFPVGNYVRGFEISPGDKEIYYFVSSFYYPSVVHLLDLQTLKTQVVTNTFIGFDQTQFETKYVTYISGDLTEIPMFLTYKKGLKLKDKNPVWMYGYGGYGISLTPFYDPSTILWIENGGIFAVPGIRGGGENGTSWHEEGRRLKKMNSFNDFIAAARYLIDSNYTSPNKLAIQGGSNGGLLVGVAMTQHPELFKAVVAEMGVYDMLRYDKFTVGSHWESEYGVSSNAKDFSNLYSYSPLHNLKKGVKYPATLVITADNDDRVPPLHSYKFVATLQELGDKTNPYLLKVIGNGGHQGSAVYEKRTETDALILLFLFKNLKVDAATVF
ncbi:MAG: prolyl oligopeptidase family serine peptidase [Bacteroidetes bacterium]|nr:prolyl oligopeptidase family serine peptidase [Bacteroidota bacterium]